ncbi:questin oxidase family protein [Nakamurella sp. GG22]
MTDPQLLASLARLESKGPEFGGFLANHGPMTVEALTHVGGTAAIERWLDGYLPQLDDAPAPGSAVNDSTWRERLGDERLLGDWTGYMLRQAEEMPWQELLTIWWPRLLEGMAASATHGMIRTAHAVRTLRDAGPDPDPLLYEELARGLGLWAARFDPVPLPTQVPPHLHAVGALAALPRLAPDIPARGVGINGRLQALVELPDLPDHLAAWAAPRSTDDALTELVGAAARVLAARPDAPIPFCHTVTAPAATRLVLPLLSDEVARRTVQVSWRVVGSLVSAFGDPRHPEEAAAASVPEAEVPRLLERLPAAAVAHGDEHVIKLTEAALREYDLGHDPTLLVAADRFRGRMPIR